MFGLKTLAIAALGLAIANASPVEHSKRDTVITTSTTGNAGGYYFSCYIENNTGATMDIGRGEYTLRWNTSSEDVVAGIGWQTGAAR